MFYVGSRFETILGSAYKRDARLLNAWLTDIGPQNAKQMCSLTVWYSPYDVPRKGRESRDIGWAHSLV